MDRRHFLAAGAIVPFAAQVGVTAQAAQMKVDVGASSLGADATDLSLSHPGIDRDRASFIMRAMSLDALVLGREANVLYTAGIVPVTLKLGLSGANFVVIPADPTVPVSLLTHQFPYYYNVADTGLPPDMEARLVASGPTTDALFYGDDAILGPSEREQYRRAQTLATGPIHTDFPAALRAALPPGLQDTGRIGCDTIEAMQLVERTVPGAQSSAGETAARHLRLIKNAYEIEAMSMAAAVNRQAAHLAVEGTRQHQTIAGLRDSFNTHSAALGNRPVFMAIDAVISDTFDAPLVDGHTILIDCVSSRFGYHGDYGRTVFIGEPRREIARKTRAVGDAWTALREELRPGMTFSQIQARGAEILASIAPGVVVPFGPHAVGLAHTEQPFEDFAGNPLDIELAPGMIISVDCPLLESSPAGTVHLEDLTLIEDDGSRPIHEVDQQIIVV